jgi:hypothetical protein
MGWAGEEGFTMTRWDQNRPIGWFPPWLEWLGSTVVFWGLLIVMVIALVFGWVLRCSGS